MIRTVLGAMFAALVLGAFGIGLGATPARADGERTTITPWRGEQTVYRTVEGFNFPANTPVRLFVSSPAREPLREISADGMWTGDDGSIWFQILPSGFAPGNLTNGVWQLRVCANACQDLTTFVGGEPPMITTGNPARLCTPFVTPYANFPTFGPPGNAIDPRTGYTFNDIVAYCGPYATPWIGVNQFLIPGDWYPGYALPYAWPYQTVYPWNPAAYNWSSPFNYLDPALYPWVNGYGYYGFPVYSPAPIVGNGQPSGFGQIMP